MKVAGALVKRRPLAQIVAHGSTGSDGQEKATAVLKNLEKAYDQWEFQDPKMLPPI